MYVHHSSNPHLILLDEYPYADRAFFKPGGFWISDDSEQSWASWCEREDFGLRPYKYSVEITEDANLLWLKTEQETIDFDNQYALQPFPGSPYTAVNWEQVKREYQGIMVFPYFYGELRWNLLWYNGWDCSSGCIWEPTKCLKIIQREPTTSPHESTEPSGTSQTTSADGVRALPMLSVT